MQTYAKVIIGWIEYGFKWKKDFVYDPHDIITHMVDKLENNLLTCTNEFGLFQVVDFEIKITEDLEIQGNSCCIDSWMHSFVSTI